MEKKEMLTDDQMEDLYTHVLIHYHAIPQEKKEFDKLIKHLVRIYRNHKAKYVD